MKKQINFCKRTLIKGLAFSAIDLREERASLFTAVEVRPEGAGAKAAADPIKRRESFMVVVLTRRGSIVPSEGEMRVPVQSKQVEHEMGKSL